MLFGGCTSGRIRAWQGRRRAQRRDERILVDRIDEHSRLGRDELGRAADPRRHHRAPARHRLERGLAEGLDQARLADDARRGDLRRHLVGWERTGELDARAAFELCAERTVADERELPFAESLEGARETEHVLPLDE
jgi:hypothetical protein